MRIISIRWSRSPLNREFLIVSTPHAKKSLAEESEKGRTFQEREGAGSLGEDEDGCEGKHWGKREGHGDAWETCTTRAHCRWRTISWPRCHQRTAGCSISATQKSAEAGGKPGYRIYISGDTLFIDELKDIRTRFQDEGIDLMLIHLGGTTIPSPSVPLLMVTMDAKQGLQLMQLLEPDVTIPIHFDDYDVFLSPRSDFESEVEKAGKSKGVVYLDRGEEYRFEVRRTL